MTNSIEYRESVLHQEQVSLKQIAEAVGTPTFTYSKSHLLYQYHALASSLAGLDFKIHYSVKANSNLSLLSLLKEAGAGFDIVSSGELSRVLTIGGDPKEIVFSGVGKTTEEIDYAIKNGVGCINVESEGELTRIISRAKILSRIVPVSIRVNPNVDAKTHPYISTGLRENKFGVSIEECYQLFKTAHLNEHLKVQGIDCHIGSQMSSTGPLIEAMKSLNSIIDRLSAEKIKLSHINIGGGLGVTYQDEPALSFTDYGKMIKNNLKNKELKILIEPGRSIVADCGILLCKVEYLKRSKNTEAPNFAVVNAGMNDLIRPALYRAWHNVMPIDLETKGVPEEIWDIVGPICESTDFLGKQRKLCVREGSLLAVMTAGAYGMSLASNYNSRGKACEVLVDNESFRVIRKRETIRDQIKLELFE